MAPETLGARTGGGGEHLFFRYQARLGREVRNSQGLLGPGLDVRAQGGYVLVAPSRTSGRHEWRSRSRPACAAWLLRCLEERARMEAGVTLF